MAAPSRFQDVEFKLLLEALERMRPDHAIEWEEGPQGELWILRNGRSQILDVFEGMVSGLSLECACDVIGVDPIELYVWLGRITPESTPTAAPTGESTGHDLR